MTYALDNEVLEAFEMLAQNEGILAAMESCRAVAEAIKVAPKMNKNQIIIVNGSGRGEKDLFITTKHFDHQKFSEYLKTY